MLYVYGALMPLRLLEEIRFWKTQEKEHTSVIRQMIPGLESQFAQVLQDWEEVFAKTEGLTQERLEAVIRSRDAISPELQAKIDQLLQASIHQSDQFVRHLFFMIDQSQAVQDHSLARIVLLHFSRESKYFLGILESMKWTHSRDSQSIGQPQELVAPQPSRSPAYTLHPYPSSVRTASAEPQHMHILESVDEQRGEPELQSDPPSSMQQLTATTEGTWSVLIDQGAHSSSPMDKYDLPPLPYSYDALEPHIDEATVRIHYNVHHRSHVQKWNHAETMLAKARNSGAYDEIPYWQRTAIHHESAHLLHTLYWNSMSAKGSKKPLGTLVRQLDRDWDGFNRFKQHFTHMANQAEEGGWVVLAWRSTAGRLDIMQDYRDSHSLSWDHVPLLALDLCEHAYYLKYRDDRARYIDAWWHLIDWKQVGERFEQTR